MNIRKNIDYSEMYKALDDLIAKELTQMELYCEIGKAVCQRSEKGAAVMASEYLNKNYPDVKGFSPRSLRRMRDFYRTYENHPTLLRCAMELGWIQNVVIMEADLTMDLREWYMKAVKQFGWSKTELIAYIAAKAHEDIVLPSEEAEHNDVYQEDTLAESKKGAIANTETLHHRPAKGIRKWWHNEKKGRRRCGTLPWERFLRNWIFFMRC